jgi:hypothetical protein
LKPLQETSAHPLESQSFRVISQSVQCLLSEEDVFIDLHGYCGFESMLQYRLDKDMALVIVSAWDHSSEQERPVATIEHITKVASGDVSALKESLEQEWRAALTKNPAETSDKFREPWEYWERPAKKVRRMESEPSAEGLAA